MMSDKKFGTAGAKLVMEEFLPGEEVSFLVFSDGSRVVPMVSVQDHKRRRRRGHGLEHGRDGHGLALHQPLPGRAQADHAGDHPAHHRRPQRRGTQVPGRALRGADDHGQGAARARVQRPLRRSGDAGHHGAHEVGHRADPAGRGRGAAEGDARSTGPRRRRSAWCSPPAAIPDAPETGQEIRGLDSLQGRATTSWSSTPPPPSATARWSRSAAACWASPRWAPTSTPPCSAPTQAVKKISFDGMHYRKDIGQKALARLHAPR